MNRHSKNRISNEDTLWEKRGGRNFRKDLKTGKDGEEIIRKRLLAFPSVIDVRDISNSKRVIDDDIDFEIVYKDGHTSTVEIKTDLMAHSTGNFAYEEYSHRNPGCFARTKADHILYFLYETGEVYVLNPVKFRTYISEMKQDKQRARYLRIRATGMGEGAFGYLVPINVLKSTDVFECMFNAYPKAKAA